MIVVFDHKTNKVHIKKFTFNGRTYYAWCKITFEKIYNNRLGMSPDYMNNIFCKKCYGNYINTLKSSDDSRKDFRYYKYFNYNKFTSHTIARCRTEANRVTNIKTKKTFSNLNKYYGKIYK